MSSHRKLLIGAASALVLALTGCAGGASASGAPGELDGRIVYAHSAGPTTLDPGAITSNQELLYLNPVYDRLTKRDPLTGELSEMLATSWVVGADGAGGYADFTLREGLTFPDGTPFTSATVVANIERSKSLTGSGMSVELAGVTDAEALSPSVVRVRSAAGAGALPNIFSGPAGMMISENALDNPDLATVPVGIGMWTLKSFDPAKVTYVKTANYWDPDVQQADELELRLMPDDTARFNAVQSGDLDATFIRPSQISAAKNAGLNLFETDGSTTYNFMLNTFSEGLDDPELRKALQLAIDREGIAKSVLGGRCSPTSQIFAPSAPWSDPTVKVPDYDPKKAKETIADLGYDGLELSLVVSDIDQYRKIAEVIQANLGEVGVSLDIQIAPASEIRQIFGIDKSVDIGHTNYGLETDPSQAVSKAFLPGGIGNPGGFSDPEINQLAADALAIADPDERAKAYQQISAASVDNATSLTICAPQFTWVTTGGIDGFEGAVAGALPEWRDVKG